jgi:hypothetical protein
MRAHFPKKPKNSLGKEVRRLENRKKLLGKNGRARPCDGTVVLILKSLPRIKDCEYFFSANGTSPASGFSKAKARLDERVTLAHYTPHDLRR